jgi:hypothetical protein
MSSGKKNELFGCDSDAVALPPVAATNLELTQAGWENVSPNTLLPG